MHDRSVSMIEFMSVFETNPLGILLALLYWIYKRYWFYTVLGITCIYSTYRDLCQVTFHCIIWD